MTNKSTESIDWKLRNESSYRLILWFFLRSTKQIPTPRSAAITLYQAMGAVAGDFASETS
jgi:hypothetical protein